MASSSSSLSSSLLPSIQAHQDHQGAAMAAPPGSSQKPPPHTTDHEDNQTKPVSRRLMRQASEILRSQHMDVKELRICVGTWNVGGLCPPTDLDIQEWLDTKEPADIYVLGFQEIISLEAGYMIGSEDNSPVAVWEHVIGETLNKKCPDKSRFTYCSAPSSPSRYNTSDYAHVVENGFLSETDDDEDGKLDPLIQLGTSTNTNSASDEQKDNLVESNNQKKSTKVLSLSERLGMVWPEQPLDIFTRHLQDSAKPSVSARHLQYLDLASDYNIDNRIKSKRPHFVQIVSKQMVGIYLSIWVHEDLQKHIQNLRLSILGVGNTPYIGNKASAK